MYMYAQLHTPTYVHAHIDTVYVYTLVLPALLIIFME